MKVDKDINYCFENLPGRSIGHQSSLTLQKLTQVMQLIDDFFIRLERFKADTPVVDKSAWIKDYIDTQMDGKSRKAAEEITNYR